MCCNHSENPFKLQFFLKWTVFKSIVSFHSVGCLVVLLMEEIRLTTWHVWNPANNGTFTTSTGAGCLPSTASHIYHRICVILPKFWWLPTKMISKDYGAYHQCTKKTRNSKVVVNDNAYIYIYIVYRVSIGFYGKSWWFLKNCNPYIPTISWQYF